MERAATVASVVSAGTNHCYASCHANKDKAANEVRLIRQTSHRKEEHEERSDHPVDEQRHGEHG